MTTVNPTGAPILPGQNLDNPTQGATPVTPTPTSPTTPTINTGTPSPTNTNTQTPSQTPANLQTIQQGIQQAQKTTQSIQEQMAQKYGTALQTAQDSGKPAPQSIGQGSAAMNSITGGPTPPPPPPNPILTQMQQDPAIQQLMQSQQQFLSAQNQQQNLEQQYTQLTQQAGIPALNTQLVNMQSVINGTDQDIRNEVQAAGGFATESQVQAMGVARNKVLVQNYNNLLQTKTDLENQINTQLGYAEKDQANASALATEQMNYAQQITSYEQKFTANAQSALSSMQQSEGWDGIYKAALASGDPTAIKQINETMGPGFDLATAAQHDALTRQQQAQASALATAKTQADIANTQANTRNTQENTLKTQQEINNTSGAPNPAKANQPGYDATGVKYNVASAQQELTTEIKNQGLTGTAHLLSPGNYNQMEAWWVSQGLSAADFKAEFGGYIDQSRVKEYN